MINWGAEDEDIKDKLDKGLFFYVTFKTAVNGAISYKRLVRIQYSDICFIKQTDNIDRCVYLRSHPLTSTQISYVSLPVPPDMSDVVILEWYPPPCCDITFSATLNFILSKCQDVLILSKKKVMYYLLPAEILL